MIVVSGLIGEGTAAFFDHSKLWFRALDVAVPFLMGRILGLRTLVWVESLRNPGEGAESREPTHPPRLTAPPPGSAAAWPVGLIVQASP